MKVSELFCCAIYAKGLQNREKVGILKAGRGENMRSDRTRKDTAKRYIAVLALLLFCSIVFYVQTTLSAYHGNPAGGRLSGQDIAVS